MEEKELKKIIRQELRKVLREELRDLVMRKIMVERGPRKQGEPEKVVVEEEWNVIDYMAGYIPYLEGALRGVQGDVDVIREGLMAISGILVGLEDSVMAMAQLANRARQLGLIEKAEPKIIDLKTKKPH
jgi:hypothetical protein